MAELKRLHAAWPTPLVLAGLLAIFVGERSFSGSDLRWLLGGGGALALLVAAVVRAWELSREPTDPSRRLLLACTLGPLASVLAYAVTLNLEGMARSAGWGAVLMLAFASLPPLMALELATAPVSHNPTYETGRNLHAFRRGLGFGLLLMVLLAVNFLAEQHDQKLRLGLGGRTVASDITRNAVLGLDTPVEVKLFFPRGNEVAEVVEDYLEPLLKLNPNLIAETVDHALAREDAERAEVRENGWVAVLKGNVKERFRLGTRETAARSMLRRLDQEFVKALLKVSTSRKVAYFTRGHAERPTRTVKGETRASVRALKRQLEALQYDVRELGLGEGLAEAVPDDAGIVFVMGPEQPFLPAEEEALLQAFRKGARMLVALDASDRNPLPGFLEGVGLSFDPTPLANTQAFVQLTKTRSDHNAIATNVVERHPAVDRLAQNRRMYTVFLRAGALEKASVPKGLKVQSLVRALPGTFADRDGSLTQGPEEPAKDYDLAMAVTTTSTQGADAEGRMVVLSDVDVVADDLAQLIQGNALLLLDALQWLQRGEDPVIRLPEDDDVKLVHRQEEDVAIFYGTTVGVPVLVLAAGFLVQRRRRR